MNKITGINLILTAITGFSLPIANATDGAEGEGGHISCIQFSHKAGHIVSELATIGQEQIRFSSGIIKVDEVLAAKRGMKCIPKKNEIRQAISFPETGEVHLDVLEWRGLGPYERLRLAAHELAVLTGYEQDGEYYVSERMIKILEDSPGRHFGQYRAKQFIVNTDHSVTYLFPYVVIDGKAYPIWLRRECIEFGKGLHVPMCFEYVYHSDKDGVCKYLRHTEALDDSFGDKSNSDYMAEISNEGYVQGLITVRQMYRRNTAIFASVTCK